MRITTNQVIKNYQSNLSKANNNLASAREKVLTGRNFNTASDDPGAASTAFTLRTQYLDNVDYIDNTKTAESRFQAVEGSVLEMNTTVQEASGLITKGISGSTSIEARKSIATSLRSMQESLVLSANAKIGDTFILGGQNTSTASYELSADNRLLYCGQDVSSTDAAVQANLQKAADAKINVDLGFGLSYDVSGNLVNNSTLNTAFSALNVLGYGTNDDGVDKNLVNLLGNIADELEKPTIDEGKMQGITKQFDDSKNQLLDVLTGLGTQSKFLEKTQSRLEDNKITLNNKIDSVENVDTAEAITNFVWSQFAYNAALKVGTSIISPSLIDFMN
ncbi:MAG: hypothetical protein LKJ25_06860 [Clostridia bacterium]|jgi:flagellar hook-associated protein 3 FlgL|nr:hypothetical protein [Clostridia bacterium]